MSGRRIAIVGPSLRGGGLERVIRDLALALVDRGDELAVFTVAGLGIHTDALRARGIAVHDCQPRGFSIPGYPRDLIEALGRFDPDLIHAHSGTWLPSAVAATLLRKPLIFTDHGRYPPEPLGRAILERACLAATRELICVSDTLAEYDRKFLHLAGKPTVIPNGIDLTAYVGRDRSKRERLRQEWGVGTDLVGIVVGRLEPVKDHAGLLAALAIARQSAPKLRLVFLGSGTLDQPLRDLCEERGLAEVVHFLGFRSDVADCLQAADFWLLGSSTEGLPISLLEALAAGLPVVSTAVGGIPAALGAPPAGLLVPPGDPPAMAAAMTRLAGSAEEMTRLGDAAAQRASQFSLDRTTEAYSRVFDRVLAASSA